MLTVTSTARLEKTKSQRYVMINVGLSLSRLGGTRLKRESTVATLELSWVHSEETKGSVCPSTAWKDTGLEPK